MTENEEDITEESGFLASKFMRILLIIISGVLIFAGPTYVIYALAVLLHANLAASFAIGFVMFVVGLVLLRYLVSKKVVS